MDILTILIVEDDPIVAASIEALVAAEGHQVCGIVAKGGSVAQSVKELRPDLIIMDVHLADGTSGAEVTKELLAADNVPVIIVSATDEPDELLEIAESGALAFIKKPISVEELKVSLRIATNHNKAMHELRKSESAHKRMFDDAAVGLYVCHKDGYYVACNKAFAKILGFSGPAELLRTVVSMDEQIYVKKGRRAEILKELGQGNTVSFATSQVYGRDGNVLWISEHVCPTTDGLQDFALYEGVAMDISAQKRAENERNVAYALMQTTMDAIADFIAVTDLEGDIIFANEAFERELGDVVGPDRSLAFANDGNCPVCRFMAELDKPVAPGYQVRGYCNLPGYPKRLSVGISRYETPESGILGAVFIMHAVKETDSDQTASWSLS
ncbi:response regulator [Desulfovibrio sp. OttesenSCG-928-G15]|nr:response regulator [Desulfovibrio sp. OttesenSCG-928-G15]